MPEFKSWPKIKRLNRDIIITEKIDGTNAAIGIVAYPFGYHSAPEFNGKRDGIVFSDAIDDNPLYEFMVYAQSRTRIIEPGKQTDNAGFATWVRANQVELVRHLGEGLHFGEWWGSGIQRAYGLTEKRFSLFNATRWNRPEGEAALTALQSVGVNVFLVPVLYRGPWTGNFGYIDGPASVEVGTNIWLDPDKQQDWSEIEGQPNPRPRFAPNFILEFLKRVGSQAAPGYMNPEGIVVQHPASEALFKATLEGDEKHKGEV